MIELIASMIIWGSLGMFVMWSGMSAIEIAFFRCLSGAIIIGIYLIISKRKIVLNQGTLVVALAGIFLVLNWILLFKSFQVASITIGNMSYYLQPVILIIFGALFLKEKTTKRQLLYIAVAFCGVVMIMITKNIPENHIVLGALLALSAAIFYSLVTLMMKRNQIGFFEVIFIQLIIGTLMLLPFMKHIHLTSHTLGYILLFGVVHTVLAYYLYYKAIKRVNLACIAIVSYIDPLAAIATDIAFFHRTLNVVQIVGIILTFIAIYQVIKPKKLKSL